MAPDIGTRARDACYTAIGFGVLGVQKLQVTRRELGRELGARLGGRAGVKRMVRRAEAAVDPVLDGVERRLPTPARSAVHTARQAGKLLEHTLLR